MNNLPVFSTLQESEGEARTAIQQTLRELKQFNRYVVNLPEYLGIAVHPFMNIALAWRRARCGVSGA